MKKLLPVLVGICMSGLAANAQSIVVNKIYNGSSTADGKLDAVELLVIQDHLDVRGMIVKDFEDNITRDAGGKYKFNDIPLWADLRSGTTIVLRRLASQGATYAEDTNPADFTLDLILENTAYLTTVSVEGHRFNITNTDMVIIKTGEANGVENLIHGFATNGGGAAGNFYHTATGPRLVSPATTGTGAFQYPLNPDKNVSDYSGAKGAMSTDENRNWGIGFGQNNIEFIAALRQTAPTNPAPEIPAAPSSLAGTATSAHEVSLSWIDNADNETGYQIERSLDGTAFTTATTTAADVTTYTDTNLSAATKYFYRLSAVGTAGYSGYSNTAEVTTQEEQETTTPGGPAPSSIVVNKIYNATSTADGKSDAIELLVVEDHLDIRGVVIKDFEDNISRDAGGKYKFNDIPLWQDLRAGTTIVLRRLASQSSEYVEDTDAADYTLDLILENTAYLTTMSVEGHRFNITNTDMVMLKNGEANGTEHPIHVFATNGGGVATSLFSTVTGAKLVSPSITGTGSFQYPLNPDKNISDYNGAKAAASSDTNRNWGYGYGQNNIDFIAALRGTAPAPEVAPDAPGAFTATATSSSEINLTWVDNASVETGYEIERSEDGTNFILVATTASNTTSYTDKWLLANTQYYYRVRAKGSSLYSEYTSPVAATTQEEPDAAIHSNKVVVPNLLSPNGDGTNDRWVITNLELYPQNVVRVFDAAGRLVYHQKNYKNNWYGTTSQNLPLSTGTYLYVVELGDGSAPLKGYLTIVKN